MGRIRSIKPETPKDEIFGKLPRDVRLLFILLWTLADDDGRFRASPALIRSELFPYDDDLTTETVADWLGALFAAGRVLLYNAKGQQYGVIATWKTHQKIDKPSPSRLPAPDEGIPADPVSLAPEKRLESETSKVLSEPSGKVRRKVDEASGWDRKGSRIGSRKGSRIGTEDEDLGSRIGTANPVVDSVADGISPPGAREFVEAFHRAFQSRHGGAKPTWGQKQGGMVKALLKKHGLEESLRRLEILARGEGPSWLVDWDLGAFIAHFDKLASPAGSDVAIYERLKREREFEGGQGQ